MAVSLRPGIIRNLLLVGGALLLAILAYWLATYYLRQRESEIVAQMNAVKPQMSQIVVAARDLVAGDTAADSNFALAELPTAHIPEEALTPDLYSKVRGHSLLRDVGKGRPILLPYLTVERVERFSDLLDPGLRAVTLAVDNLNSADGMLMAGDHVDLVLLSSAEMDGVNGGKAEELIPILEDVTVLATGQAPTVPLPADGQDDGRLPDRGEYSTVTVGVTPREAQKVLLASEAGKVVTLLRNREDGSRFPTDIIHQSALRTGMNSNVQYFSGGKVKDGVLTPDLRPVVGSQESSGKVMQVLPALAADNKTAAVAVVAPATEAITVPAIIAPPNHNK